MGTGALDVFSRRDDQPGIDTAVLILVDGSTSMRANIGRNTSTPTRMELAVCAAWHIAKAAEAANAKVAIGVFRSAGMNNLGANSAAVSLIKPWAKTVHQCAGVILGSSANGTTPLAPAIIECARELAGVSATRRLLMVLTDGQCDYGADGVQRACVLADDLGVETVGVGMACADVVRAFPPRYSVNVDDLRQLAKTGLGKLCAMLEDANPRGAD